MLIAPNLPHSSGMPQVGHTKARNTYSRLQWRPDIDSYYDRQKDLYVPIFRKLEKDNERVRIIDPTNLLCNDQECRMTDNKELLYRDHNHLSYKGSQYVGGWVGSQIQRRD